MFTILFFHASLAEADWNVISHFKIMISKCDLMMALVEMCDKQSDNMNMDICSTFLVVIGTFK